MNGSIKDTSGKHRVQFVIKESRQKGVWGGVGGSGYVTESRDRKRKSRGVSNSQTNT